MCTIMIWPDERLLAAFFFRKVAIMTNISRDRALTTNPYLKKDYQQYGRSLQSFSNETTSFLTYTLTKARPAQLALICFPRALISAGEYPLYEMFFPQQTPPQKYQNTYSLHVLANSPVHQCKGMLPKVDHFRLSIP